MAVNGFLICVAGELVVQVGGGLAAGLRADDSPRVSINGGKRRQISSRTAIRPLHVDHFAGSRPIVSGFYDSMLLFGRFF